MYTTSSQLSGNFLHVYGYNYANHNIIMILLHWFKPSTDY